MKAKPVDDLDMTPDLWLPLRILKAYRAMCDRHACVDHLSSTAPLAAIMNHYQEQRAEILDHAIRVLQRDVDDQESLKPKARR